MEWTTVVVSVLTSGVMVGIFAFTIKKYVESAIKARFDEQLERQKSVLSVDTEKRKVVTQSQIDAYREALGLVYRIRNSCRELREKLAESGLTREELVEHSKLNGKLIDLLYEQRAILHEEVFSAMHSLKYQVLLFNRAIAVSWSMASPEEDEPFDETRKLAIKEINHGYEIVDELYKEIIIFVQDFLGVEEAQLLAAQGERDSSNKPAGGDA